MQLEFFIASSVEVMSCFDPEGWCEGDLTDLLVEILEEQPDNDPEIFGE